MEINVGEDRDGFQDAVQRHQEIAFPVVLNGRDVWILPDEGQPGFMGHHAAGIGEQQDKPYQAQHQIYNADALPYLGPALCDAVEHHRCTQDQERYAGKVVIDIRSSGNKHPGQELSQQSNQDESRCNVPITSGKVDRAILPCMLIAMR